MLSKGRKYGLLIGLLAFVWACDVDPIDIPDPDPGDTTQSPPDTLDSNLGDGPIDWTQFTDTYGHLASEAQVNNWAHYNVHDPSIIDNGDFFYSYSTDVAFGHSIRPGVQIRRSKNLVEWEFVGWVFNGIPGAASSYITANGGTANNGLWAPYAIKVGDEYRVYYSLASNVGRLSAIGLAVSSKPYGPFSDKGIVVRSINDNQPHTNAIDPTVIIAPDGAHYMYYGSSWDGIYRMELNPETGLAKTPGDIGVRVAHRGFTNGTINGNIEGPEIIYNEQTGFYYLFIAYDWLETKYNVRVGRSLSPIGPFMDVEGNDMNAYHDDLPMILAPYRFAEHSGWQGVSHPAVFKRDQEYFIATQGRPGENPYYMVMHVRQMHWTEDGWPVVSPQRYADEDESPVEASELAGTWEQIVFGYTVVPGFADTQTSPDFQTSALITLDEGGTINGEAANAWSYEAPWLTLTWADGTYVDEVYVERGRDWEKSVAETILFTGFNQDHTTIWGKKID